LEVIAKVLFPALVDLENIMMFFDEKVFSLKMAKFQISVFFKVCSHEKISVSIRIPFFHMNLRKCCKNWVIKCN